MGNVIWKIWHYSLLHIPLFNWHNKLIIYYVEENYEWTTSNIDLLNFKSSCLISVISSAVLVWIDTFESGKIYGIYGINGSGKTMLLRAIAGFINTDKGYIKYNHKALHKDMDVLPDLGAVIENISFWSMYSGFENLKMLSNIKGIVSDEEIYEIMIYFGLDPKSKKKVNKYSLGMRQKLALCQALMEHPKILLLDEPTNALDQHSIDLFRERILEEKKNDTITILTSHNKEDIEILADEKICMEFGKIKELM